MQFSWGIKSIETGKPWMPAQEGPPIAGKLSAAKMSKSQAKLYVETSVVSYLVAFPSRDLLILSRQEITKTWWETSRSDFDCFVSEVVLAEASAGDVQMAAHRLQALDGIPVLSLTADIERLAGIYIQRLLLPRDSFRDALHIASASLYQMDFVITWNCRHLANGHVRRRVRELNTQLGVSTPTICTPEELTHGNQDLV